MSRALTAGEVALARSVFGEAIDYRRVRILTRSFGGWAVVIGSTITLPPFHAPADFSAESWRTRAWLIHELTHVWQFQTTPIRTLTSWAKTLLGGGYGPGLPGYRYPVPIPSWGTLNLEQQASVVEHAFLLKRTGRCETGASLEDYQACVPF